MPTSRHSATKIVCHQCKSIGSSSLLVCPVLGGWPTLCPTHYFVFFMTTQLWVPDPLRDGWRTLFMTYVFLFVSDTQLCAAPFAVFAGCADDGARAQGPSTRV
jgi:hypothetical protein